MKQTKRLIGDDISITHSVSLTPMDSLRLFISFSFSRRLKFQGSKKQQMVTLQLFRLHLQRRRQVVTEDSNLTTQMWVWQHPQIPATENEARTCSCLMVILTCSLLAFWFLVSLALIVGVYGSVSLLLGPNSSYLIRANPIFVEYVKVEQSSDTNTGQMLYGFYNDPPLDSIINWSETHSASLSFSSHKDWIYYLNEGSQINISYSVNSASSSSLVLVIAKGSEGLAQWLEEPSYPNSALSWNIIHGNGLIQQDIKKSSSYYIAVGNLNSEFIEVQLDLQIRASVYNTTEAYYKYTLAHGQCRLKLFFPSGNAAVLTTPGPKQGISSDSYVKLSYKHRWMAYVVGIAGMTAQMLLAFQFFNNFRYTPEDRIVVQYGGIGSERVPLLSNTDDDLLSWGSSSDSSSQDDDDPEDNLEGGQLDGKPVKDGEYNSKTRCLCAICYDSPRDCFFLPCGHCV